MYVNIACGANRCRRREKFKIYGKSKKWQFFKISGGASARKACSSLRHCGWLNFKRWTCFFNSEYWYTIFNLSHQKNANGLSGNITSNHFSKWQKCLSLVKFAFGKSHRKRLMFSLFWILFCRSAIHFQSLLPSF